MGSEMCIRDRYYLGNVFNEPIIHARNNMYDYVAVYGSLAPGKPFGFRYTGHHFDLSFMFDGAGGVTDLPVFLGHNPLVVPRASPPTPSATASPRATRAPCSAAPSARAT